MASGIELAGTALSMISLISEIFKAYSKLVDYTERGDAPFLLTRLRMEKARFETVVQRLSLVNESDSEELRTFRNHIALSMDEVDASFDQAMVIVRRQEGKTHQLTRALRWRLQDKEKLEDIILRLSSQNDALGSLVQTVLLSLTIKNSRADEAIIPSAYTRGWSGKTLVPEDQNSVHQHPETVGESIPRTVSPGRISLAEIPAGALNALHPEYRPSRGHLLEHLVKASADLLTFLPYEQPEFAQVLDSFRLWQLAIESEGLYHALDCVMREPHNSHGQAVGNLILRAIIRIDGVLTWYSRRIGQSSRISREWLGAIAECDDAVERIYDEEPSLPKVTMDDFSNSSGDLEDAKRAALRAVQICIGTLRNSLTMTVRLARQYPKQVEDMSAPEVVQLLDAATELVEPAAQALLKASAASAGPKAFVETQKVDMESIQRTFDEQAALLQKWKRRHRQNIEIKLVQNSPSKLALVADAVENIGKILLDLPTTLADEAGTAPGETSLQQCMKGFEVSVQSLLNLEQELDSMTAPPSYEIAPRDRVVIAVT